MAVLRLLTGAEITKVKTFGYPAKALAADARNLGLMINGRWRLSTGIECMVFAEREPFAGVEVRAERAAARWSWNAPKLHDGAGNAGLPRDADPAYPPFPWAKMPDHPPLQQGYDHLVASIRSFVDVLHLGRPSSSLFVSGHDLRQSLEAVIASKVSAMEGGGAVPLPLADRSLGLMPSPYRLLGGDAAGNPQSAKDASGESR